MNRAAGVAKPKMNSTAKCWLCHHSKFSPTASGHAVHTALGTKLHCHCYWKTEKKKEKDETKVGKMLRFNYN